MKRHHILWAFLAVFLAAVLLLWPHLAGGQRPGNAPSFGHASLVILQADGKKLSFDVEVATTPAQHAYGLMFRHSLPPDAGMLFLFVPDQRTAFWMKNTYIPLDMLFVRGDGTIARIAVKAEPLNLALIDSGEPVRGVIEINGGAAETLGIKPGDKVLYPAFSGR